MAKFLDDNALTYLWTKITAAFAKKTDVPTKTSQLQNDSHFITTSDIPEGAAASTTVPKMDGTATVGSELAFARGDHVHPHDTSKLNKAGDTMTGDLAMGNHKITGLATPTANTDAAPKGYVDNTIANKANKSTTLSGYGITDAYTKTEIDGKLSSTYKPAGSVAYASLPEASASNLGNVYSVSNAFTTDSRFVEGSGKAYPAGTNVVVVFSSSTYKYDVLAGFVDLSGYWQKTGLTAMQNSDIDDIVAKG